MTFFVGKVSEELNKWSYKNVWLLIAYGAVMKEKLLE